MCFYITLVVRYLYKGIHHNSTDAISNLITRICTDFMTSILTLKTPKSSKKRPLDSYLGIFHFSHSTVHLLILRVDCNIRFSTLFVKKLFFSFSFFFYRSSSALHRQSSTEILFRPLGHLLCRGSPNVRFSFLVAVGFKPKSLSFQCGRFTASLF